ncbi:Endoribonuclease YbeY [Candidatus Arsenophonus lipoptenae]|uniref:Endoribonuclease YbeY n=1 Tax=Candidatus Arsenophonus lipoptenae TaxID=634113 RepID=A0A0X9VJ61_9GAMM|nr:rRNA maturation RNase YbeY [Candidatus Arsenophonus lipoptenae]AMA65035.1 Endoribonuclease YbeY [Candidatus Arsenophonus lipoptenae]
MKSVVLDLQLACKDCNGLPSKMVFQYWLEVCLINFQFKNEITIRIVDIPEIQYLNLAYRGKNKPTNILSFRFESLYNNKIPLLGDLVICRQIVEQEAIEQQKNINAYWAHMVIHGCLHLLGYNHQNDLEAEVMETMETIIIKKLGYPDPYNY